MPEFKLPGPAERGAGYPALSDIGIDPVDERYMLVYKREIEAPRLYQYSEFVHDDANLAYIRSKGSAQNNFDEASKFVKGGIITTGYVGECLDYTLDYTTGFLAGEDLQPMPYDEVLRKKNRQSDPGYPYNLAYTKTGVLVDEHLPTLVEYFVELERKICDGEPVKVYYEVFSKDDKYSHEKIKTQRYRTIQNADLFLYSIGTRWLKKPFEVLKQKVPQFRTSCYKPHEWNEIVWQKFRDKFTVGLDYTAWDRGVAYDAAFDIIFRMMKEGGAPDSVAAWVASSILSSPLVVKLNGKVCLVEHCGGNCSGQPFTTDLNQVFHLFLNITMYSVILRVNPCEVLDRLTMVLCGDDELLGGTKEDMELVIERAPELAKDWFGMDAKVDSDKGKPYPPGLHASFLDQTTYEINGYGLPVPVRTFRRMAKLWFECDDFLETLPGVYQAMEPWYIVRSFGLEYPRDLDILDEVLKRYRRYYRDGEFSARFASVYKMKLKYGVPDLE